MSGVVTQFPLTPDTLKDPVIASPRNSPPMTPPLSGPKVNGPELVSWSVPCLVGNVNVLVNTPVPPVQDPEA